MKPNPSHRGDPLFLADLLRFVGVEVVEHPGWKVRGHGDFGRIQGVIAHHTGSNTTPAHFIANHPQLGLCSQIHLARDGVATICGAGIAWHAGRGSAPGWPTDNANSVSIGIEAQSDGTSPWPEVQLKSYYRICAAILWYLGKDSASPANLLGHKEYSGRTQGKWDPGGIDMDSFRSAVSKEMRRLQTGKPEEKVGLAPDERQSIDDIREQLTGARTPGLYIGWPQLGGRTLVDAVAKIGAALQIPGFQDPEES